MRSPLQLRLGLARAALPTQVRLEVVVVEARLALRLERETISHALAIPVAIAFPGGERRFLPVIDYTLAARLVAVIVTLLLARRSTRRVARRIPASKGGAHELRT